jgi:hypothetical protein
LAIAITLETTGTVAAGATAITGTVTMNGAKIAGGDTIMAVIVGGITARRTSGAIVKAGAIAMTVADLEDMATDTDIAINTVTQKRSHQAPFFMFF